MFILASIYLVAPMQVVFLGVTHWSMSRAFPLSAVPEDLGTFPVPTMFLGKVQLISSLANINVIIPLM